MPPGEANQTGVTWVVFAFMTVVSWGVYGVFLHKGQGHMADPVNGRYKAFLFVGVAYFLTAVLAPIGMLLVQRSDWSMPIPGMAWSLLAGIVGAIGAFCVLLAFGAKGSPAVVMSIIFGGAPIVNAAVAITLDRTWGHIRWQFLVGIILAAVGGGMVTLFKPPPGKHQVPSASGDGITPRAAATVGN
jgi:drug/metabolite transporter (DMT)-like permease